MAQGVLSPLPPYSGAVFPARIKDSEDFHVSSSNQGKLYVVP